MLEIVQAWYKEAGNTVSQDELCFCKTTTSCVRIQPWMLVACHPLLTPVFQGSLLKSLPLF